MDAATQPIPITSGSALSGMLSAAVEISAQPEPEVAGPDLAEPELAGPDLAEPDLAGPGLAAGPEPEVPLGSGPCQNPWSSRPSGGKHWLAGAGATAWLAWLPW